MGGIGDVWKSEAGGAGSAVVVRELKARVRVLGRYVYLSLRQARTRTPPQLRISISVLKGTWLQ